MYLISVYFDKNANKILQRYVNLIAEKTGNDFMTKNMVPPHMTIAAVEARSVDVLKAPFENLIEQNDAIKSGKIKIVSVGQLFPYVMYATPVLNEYLLSLSSAVCEAFEGMNEVTLSKYYKPGSWLPHVTLGKTLTKDQMQIAFSVLQDNFQPFDATVVEIGLAKVNPHEDVIKKCLL